MQVESKPHSKHRLVKSTYKDESLILSQTISQLLINQYCVSPWSVFLNRQILQCFWLNIMLCWHI